MEGPTLCEKTFLKFLENNEKSIMVKIFLVSESQIASWVRFNQNLSHLLHSRQFWFNGGEKRKKRFPSNRLEERLGFFILFSTTR